MYPFWPLNMISHTPSRQFTGSLRNLLTNRAKIQYKAELVNEINRAVSNAQQDIEYKLDLHSRFGLGSRLRGTVLV